MFKCNVVYFNVNNFYGRVFIYNFYLKKRLLHSLRVLDVLKVKICMIDNGGNSIDHHLIELTP